MKENISYCCASENSIIIYFSNKITPHLFQKIMTCHQKIIQVFGQYYLDGVACYHNLTIFYDINHLTQNQALKLIELALSQANKEPMMTNQTKHIVIPVYYDDKVGFDLSDLLKQKRLTKQALIDLHTQTHYQVYGVGFAPNFAYLGKLNEKLCTPRLSKPRASVPAGSVGIADCQTGVYPIDSPGGWSIIGRTPWDLSINGKVRFSLGDLVSFQAINEQKYFKLGGK